MNTLKYVLFSCCIVTAGCAETRPAGDDSSSSPLTDLSAPQHEAPDDPVELAAGETTSEADQPPPEEKQALSTATVPGAIPLEGTVTLGGRDSITSTFSGHIALVIYAQSTDESHRPHLRTSFSTDEGHVVAIRVTLPKNPANVRDSSFELGEKDGSSPAELTVSMANRWFFAQSGLLRIDEFNSLRVQFDASDLTLVPAGSEDEKVSGSLNVSGPLTVECYVPGDPAAIGTESDSNAPLWIVDHKMDHPECDGLLEKLF